MKNPQARRRQSKSQKKSPAETLHSPGEQPAPDLRDFAVSFFRIFGAEVTALDRRKNGPLAVELPPELADHFGAARLGLAFQSVAEGSGHQLVAHGSRTFDRMLAWLERRSALTVRRLPALHSGSESLLQAVRPRNCAIAALRLSDTLEPLFAFHWRLTYRADDKREEIYTVLLDEEGRVLPPFSLPPDDVPGENKTGNGGTVENPSTLERLLAASEPFAVAHTAPGAKAAPAPALAAAENGENIESNEGIEAAAGEEAAENAQLPAGTRLPPVTRLVRMAEQARRHAIYHADMRCVAYEADILPRLYKALSRLTTYYGQQIEELRDSSDPLGDRREVLENDLQRKTAEEVENHRLRVRVELVAYAALFVPVAVADMTLSDGKREVRVRVRLERYTGQVRRPLCHACGQETESLILCRNGHIACDACLRQCAGCNDMLCADCGVQACPVCGRANCDECGRSCWACGERACANHSGRCPTCGDEVCHNCQTECGECGVRQCRSHLRSDAVAVLDGNGAQSHRLICPACAVRCPGCKQYSARLGLCALSGQRFCRNCLVRCQECGREVGPGFYSRSDTTGAIFCTECVRTCPTCRRPASVQFQCSQCGAPCCDNCRRICSVCGEILCEAHAETAPGCGHVLCPQHSLKCHVGGEAVCGRCSYPCAICNGHYCSHHQRLCAWCGKYYCVECVDDRSGLCSTCAGVTRRGTIVVMQKEPAAASRDVQLLLTRYTTWRRAENRDLCVYIGEGTGQRSVLVIARKSDEGVPFVVTRKLTDRDLAAGWSAR